LGASLFSFLTTIISFIVLYNILTKLDQEHSLIAIVIYSLGIGDWNIFGNETKIGTEVNKKFLFYKKPIAKEVNNMFTSFCLKCYT